MAKLTILLASFIALLFLVDASIYRTTVIVDEENDGESRGRGGSCRDQIQRQQNLRQCQEYIRQQVSGQGSRGRGSDDEYYNPQERESVRGCCDHLKQMDSQCRCEGLSQAIEQQQSQGQIKGEDVREAYRTAQDLPSVCGVSPSQCQFRQRSEF